MKQQALRFFAMVILVVTFAFVSALASSVAAQTPNDNVIADIPFEFNVGDKTLPAGKYLISEITRDGAALRVSNRQEAQSASRLTSAILASRPKEQSMLIFERYGERYYLSQVWVAGEKEGRAMLKSRSQRALDSELARKNEKAETISIAAL